MIAPNPGRSDLEDSPADDEILVRECLLGSENSWSKLVRKYANLIYSIPIKRGFAPEDAADVFQSVCVALVHSLGSIREPRALAAWVIQTTGHACNRLQTQRHKSEALDLAVSRAAASEGSPDELIAQFERGQLVRQAVAGLNPECQKLIQLLFLSDPPMPYEKAAAQLGLAKGSIGATRMRCLEKLRASLEKKGFV